MSIDKLVEAVKEFEKNIPKDFETQFREWWDLVWENHLELDSSEFDFIDAINNFLENPKGCWLAEKQYREELDEQLQKDIEADEKNHEYFTNSFGIKMTREKGKK